jgi:hypothetical protein
MPITARVFCRASIVYLGIGALLGVILLINRWLPLGGEIPLLKSSHVVMLIAGWLTQFILGVAWWLFPPLDIGAKTAGATSARRGQTQRGSEPLFWATFAALNAGVLLRAISGPLYSWTQIGFLDVLSRSSNLLLLAAALAFVANMWRRVRELGAVRAV